MTIMRISQFCGILMMLAVLCRGGETATASPTVIAGYVTAVKITSEGAGYTATPAVTIVGGGGSGATARAILASGRVTACIVLTAGSGYTSVPIVLIDAPPAEVELEIELIPKIKFKTGRQNLSTVQWSSNTSGPWFELTNFISTDDGTTLIDPTPGTLRRFYKAYPKQVGPEPGVPPGFVWIAPGNFVRGSPQNEQGRGVNEGQHTVVLTQGFWLADHEVTQEEYEQVTGNNPSFFKGYPYRPVDQVSWIEAVAYCQKLTERDRQANRITERQTYRLPTEAEWEYAARAGTTGMRYGELNEVAWYNLNSGRQTNPVKLKVPNAWGLYDMLGNVWEWCSDWYGTYPSGIITDPTDISSTRDYKIFRGGSCNSDDKTARSAVRSGHTPGYKANDVGFRVALITVR